MSNTHSFRENQKVGLTFIAGWASKTNLAPRKYYWQIIDKLIASIAENYEARKEVARILEAVGKAVGNP